MRCSSCWTTPSWGGYSWFKLDCYCYYFFIFFFCKQDDIVVPYYPFIEKFATALLINMLLFFSAIRISGGWYKIKACRIGLLAVSIYKYPILIFQKLFDDMVACKHIFVCILVEDGIKLFFHHWRVAFSWKNMLIPCSIVFHCQNQIQHFRLIWLVGFNYGPFRQFPPAVWHIYVVIFFIINDPNGCLFSTINILYQICGC